MQQCWSTVEHLKAKSCHELVADSTTMQSLPNEKKEFMAVIELQYGSANPQQGRYLESKRPGVERMLNLKRYQST